MGNPMGAGQQRGKRKAAVRCEEGGRAAGSARERGGAAGDAKGRGGCRKRNHRSSLENPSLSGTGAWAHCCQLIALT